MEIDMSTIQLYFYILNFLLLINTVLFYHGCNLAIGRNVVKLFKKESVLHSQFFVATVSVAGLVLSLFQDNGLRLFWIIFTADLFLDIVFYLQPTPRVGKILRNILILVNIAFCILFLTLVSF